MTDRCASCFAPLKRHPLGGRYACFYRNCPKEGYWSEAAPEGTSTKDRARLVSKRGQPTLYYYRA